jgi:kynurenine formamidase
MSRIVDLSAPIESTDGASELQRNQIEYFDHAAGAAEIEAMFGVPARLLRDGEGWTRELVTLGTHNTTHVDAPWHYNSTIAGSPAATIDELPLERFFGPGVVVDFTAKEDGDSVTAGEMEAALGDHELRPGDILLVRTGRDEFYGREDYVRLGPGVTAEATRWLYDRGVRVMGIDAWSWDRPLHLEAAEALERDAAGVFWAAHQVDLDYSQLERLVNLSALPPSGFTVACFPLRIVRASGAPARVVAILD